MLVKSRDDFVKAHDTLCKPLLDRKIGNDLGVWIERQILILEKHEVKGLAGCENEFRHVLVALPNKDNRSTPSGLGEIFPK